MKEHRKKEIIVERYEAKLKEEHEQLAYEMQRANETRQRNQGQRNRNTGAARAGGVLLRPNLLFYFILFYFILFYFIYLFRPNIATSAHLSFSFSPSSPIHLSQRTPHLP